jgi:hypothetical protein
MAAVLADGPTPQCCRKGYVAAAACLYNGYVAAASWRLRHGYVTAVKRLYNGYVTAMYRTGPEPHGTAVVESVRAQRCVRARVL